MSVKDHRKTLLKSLILIFICAALVSAPACSSSGSKFSVTYTDLFDTVTEFTAYCSSVSKFNEVSDALQAELLRLHRLFDIYNEYDGITNLAYLNRTCGDSPQKAGKEIIELIDLGLIYCEKTDGKMNIFAGAVTSVWHKYRQSGSGIPTDEELKEAAKHIFAQSVKLDNGTVYFTDKDLKIDVGATAKGYASQIASQMIKSMGVNDFALNIGGNVVVSGQKPDGLWKIGVQDPGGDGLYTKVKVSDISVVTSGDYQRCYEYNGKKYHHIIDLITLYPAENYSSVTVICKDAAAADALSTALFLVSVEEGEALLKQYDAEALWIKSDGTPVRTAGFSAYE
ncbi:MAG: FAD:protein FMN transferase [Clostridia bacterium]|nr:FAD:protein FMN transferase [Clostridia bacterium]